MRLPSIGVFARIDSDEPEKMSVGTIAFNESLGKYDYDVSGRSKQKFITVFNEHDLTGSIVQSVAFQGIARMDGISQRVRFLGEIDTLVSEVIKQTSDPHIGGEPTILLLQKGKRPRWHKKAGDCPDLG